MFGGGVGTDVLQPFMEAAGPRAERSLISRRLFTIIRLARFVGHAFGTRDEQGAIAAFRRPQGGRTIRSASGPVKNRCQRGNAL